jgi:hypothetical protein
VRTTGDWTTQLQNLQPQDGVLFDGSYGLLGHLRVAQQNEIFMIRIALRRMAGYIGGGQTKMTAIEN